MCIDHVYHVNQFMMCINDAGQPVPGVLTVQLLEQCFFLEGKIKSVPWTLAAVRLIEVECFLLILLIIQSAEMTQIRQMTQICNQI